MSTPPYLRLDNLQGGIADDVAPFSIEDNEVVEAKNIDYRAGRIGTKRGGLSAIALTSSVFVRDVPIMRQRDVGGWSGSASGTVSVTAYGAAATNHLLLVSIANTGGTVTAVDLGGVALTQQATVANTSRVDVWYLRNPSIAGGTLTVTLSGSGDARISAERWDNVDTASSPVSSATSTGTSATPYDSSAAYNPTHMVIQAATWGSATATLQTIGVHASVQGTSGSARLFTVAELGMKPTTQFASTLSGSVVWASIVVGILGVSITTGRPIRAVMRFEPTNELTGDELWLQDDFGRLDRRVSGTWQTGVPVVNYQVGSFLSSTYWTNATSLHGKFFLALDGTLYADRLHVWDGTVLRWAGFTAPSAAPTGANTGVGSVTGTRYYRYRYAEVSGSTTLRRSEPSAVLTFAPSGTGTAVRVTGPSAATFLNNEGQTSWELEASTDNVLFYRIATTTIGSTYDDTISASTGYEATGTLSESLTEYTPLPAARHVVVDEDRLLIGGSPTTAINDSRVSWTPLRGETGVGNDERVPATIRYFEDLDGLSGGRITHMMPAVMGGVFAFKLGRTYKFVRTGLAGRAYRSIQLSPNRGCLPRAGCDGTTEKGTACVYFVDPNVGACRYTFEGLEDLMQERAVTTRINKAASVVARSMFYPKHWLLWVSVALDAGTTPNYLCCFNVREGTWTDYTGNMATWLSGVLFPDATTQELRPLLALGTAGTRYLVEADNGVNDDGVRYRGYVVTKAYVIGQLFREFEISGGSLHALAGSATIAVIPIRNLGLETKAVAAVSIAATGSQTYATKLLDDLTMAELEQIQFEIGDPSAYTGSQLDQTWTLEALVVKYTSGTEGG